MRKIGSIIVAVVIAITSIITPMEKTMNTVKASSSVIERAISWAIAIANDNSHGYSQTSRWGPDYDCSSFVISAFRSAGVNVGTATYTGNMRAQFTQHGFQWIPWGQIGNTANLRRGDILLNEKTHTEIYIGDNKNVGAHSNRGYPQTGDQTGTEVSVSGYYYHPWNGVLRYVGNEVCNCSTEYAGEYYVSTSSLPLTMRSGHGTGYSVITSIPKGSTVYVSRADGSWAHVEWNGYSGYCSLSYLTRIESKNYSYNLHVWMSDTKMGDVPTKFVKGNRYYLCYELTNETTGQKVNETENMNYSATETIRNASGKVFEYTYEKSDNNWISFVCDSEDEYTGTVTINGDVGISCSVSFDAYADTSPQIKVWAWEDDDSKEIDSIDIGKKAYCSYLIRDKYTKENLNDVTVYWKQGNGYTVTVKVYDPSGALIKTESYKNNDCTWFSFEPDKIGKYKIKTEVTGNLAGSYERTITAEEKEHKFGGWTITKEATCVQEGSKYRICSICEKKEIQQIQKKEHVYNSGTVTKKATCEDEGEKVYSCRECGHEKIQVIPAQGHSIVMDKAIAPSNTKDGVTEGKHCSVCGKIIIKQEVIPAIGNAATPHPTLKPTVTQTPEGTPTEKTAFTAVPTMSTNEYEDATQVSAKTAGKEKTVSGNKKKDKNIEEHILKSARKNITITVKRAGKSVGRVTIKRKKKAILEVSSVPKEKCSLAKLSKKSKKIIGAKLKGNKLILRGKKKGKATLRITAAARDNYRRGVKVVKIIVK